uniref:NADH deshydrogenase subunit 6 n=1 Tax=Aderidae sp. GENSP01 TaxID=1205532 RepID=A0A0S2MP95_9CUCU|nr:NADH deshydrogenase subunit 6 [Aderidae sp. GENSP01]
MILMLTSISIIFLSHPMSLGIMLFFQTILISLITGSFSLNFLLFLYLFIIMVGGMLIIFIYMINIAANEKFNLNLFLMFFYLTIIMTWFISKWYNMMNFFIFNQETLNLPSIMKTSYSMSKYFFLPMSMIMIFMMIYLFIILILTVKISNFNKGPMRQIN